MLHVRKTKKNIEITSSWSICICFLFSEKMKHLLLVPSISLLLDFIAFCWFTHAILPVLGNYLEMYGKFFIGHFHFMFVNCIIYWSMLVSPCFFLGPLIIELFSWQWIADIWSPQAADGGPKSAAPTVRSTKAAAVANWGAGQVPQEDHRRAAASQWCKIWNACCRCLSNSVKRSIPWLREDWPLDSCTYIWIFDTRCTFQ